MFYLSSIILKCLNVKLQNFSASNGNIWYKLKGNLIIMVSFLLKHGKKFGEFQILKKNCVKTIE